MEDPLTHAIEIAKIGAGREGYRAPPGCGGIWAGRNNQYADATFVDWGLARATAEILNAVLDGRLVRKETELAEKFTDEDRLDFLQDAAKESRTGLSVDYVPSVDGEKSGYRVMTFHNIGPVGPTIRDALDHTMSASGRWGHAA